jgi:hypothetical protein
MEIELARSLQQGRAAIRQHIRELELGDYETVEHFRLLGQRLFHLPGLIDLEADRKRLATIDYGNGLELNLGCQYKSLLITNDPANLSVMTATWEDATERGSTPLLSQVVYDGSRMEELFAFEQTLFEVELNQGTIPDPSLVVYRNEPAYVTSISQRN